MTEVPEEERRRHTPQEIVEERVREVEAGSSFSVHNPDLDRAMQNMMKIMRPAVAQDKPLDRVRSDDPAAQKSKQKEFKEMDRDSPERRQALEMHLKGLGVDEKLRQVRLIADLGQKFPPGQTINPHELLKGKDGNEPPGRERGGPERGPDGLGRDR